MLVSERERVRYDSDRDYGSYQSRDRYSRYDYDDSGYEADRMRTSNAYRDSLMSSLERPATRSRLERTDEDRYFFYKRNISATENNYDKFWDSKHEATPAKRPSSKKKAFLIAAYMFIALVAIIAVTLSVVGLGETKTVQKTVAIESMAANAEMSEAGEIAVSAAATEKEEMTLSGGETYILLKSGELLEVKVPEQSVTAKEKEKGFDKFCNWLNGVIGG